MFKIPEFKEKKELYKFLSTNRDLLIHAKKSDKKIVQCLKVIKTGEITQKAKLENVEELRRLSEGSDLEARTITQARALEGSVRNTGTHACGVIITPEKITNLIPVATAKDSDMYVTQFDNNVVESAGLLKMDFFILGAKLI